MVFSSVYLYGCKIPGLYHPTRYPIMLVIIIFVVATISFIFLVFIPLYIYKLH